MEFNRTKADIKDLEERGDVSVDELISVICDLFLDSGKPEKLPVSDDSGDAKKEFTRNLYIVSEKIVNIYENNKKNLNIPVNADLRAVHEKNKAELKIAQIDLKEIEKSIREEETSKNNLDEEKSRLEAKKRELLVIRNDCEALCVEIKKLSDPALEKIAEENERLTKEYEERKARYDGLIAEKTRITGEIEAEDIKISEAEAEITEKTKTKSDKENEYKERQKEKGDLDKKIEEYNNKIDECDKYIEEFPVKVKGLKEKAEKLEADAKALEDLKNGTLVILNGALKTAFDDELLKTELLNIPGAADSVGKITETKIEKVEDIEKVAAELKKGAEARVKAMEDLLRAINEGAKKLTEPSCGSAK